MGIAIYGALLLIMMFLGVPIAYSMIASTVVYIIGFSNIGLITACKQMIAGVNSFTLLALPFFLLLGEMLGKSGITERLIMVSRGAVGHMKGSLAQINNVTSMLLACVQGAATSSTAAVGSIMIPAMKKEGYSGAYAAAITSAAATLGPIIPPSLTMVVFGSVGGVSIGRLFLGGITPGIIMAIFLIIYCALKARKGSEYCGNTEPFSWKKLWTGLKAGAPTIIIPVIILGGITFGIFTATESGTFAVIATIFLGIVVYKSLSLKQIWECFKGTVPSLANISIVIAAASAFGWILTREGAIDAIGDGLLSISSNRIIIMLIMNVVLLIAGCFIETLANVILFTPIFLPIAVALGYDPIHFGVIVVINLTLGTITPPLGVCMFMASDIAKCSIEEYMKEMVPIYIPLFIALLIVILVPPLSTWIPNMLMPV